MPNEVTTLLDVLQASYPVCTTIIGMCSIITKIRLSRVCKLFYSLFNVRAIMTPPSIEWCRIFRRLFLKDGTVRAEYEFPCLNNSSLLLTTTPIEFFVEEQHAFSSQQYFGFKDELRSYSKVVGLCVVRFNALSLFEGRELLSSIPRVEISGYPSKIKVRVISG